MMKQVLGIGIMSLCIMGGLMQDKADAAAMLTIDDLSNGIGVDFSATDNGSNDLSGNQGQILFNSDVGSWNASGTAVTKPFAGSTATAPFLDLNSLDVSNPNGGNLVIEFSDDGFTGNTSGFLGAIGGNSNHANTIVTYEAFLSNTNTKFDTSNSLGSVTLQPGSGATIPNFSGIFNGLGNSGDPYALTLRITLTHEVGQFVSTSYDANLQAVPEPGTMFLFGSGLVGLGLWRWRKTQA